ncbi:hypothetical protein CC85DRAFT_292445 [Cutaneotrichosporon oleaginosum]|uniref:Uncharacterized protein n=1 Tax=Cutaneotrichosporon oleaginosum TaxID=879819 RepID=A0A0J0XL90_9TREE|nr:uncharacterized protein CC85DRAFT_292445 [Cutaneotrichosporon oleaginosum]KLT41852.1 hypothetical protein CC85DRAFT_292445 [Cutaneotrichosporon oleaginosum]TXT14771.1 hypothetical protein COLE_00964 [Cutaneotrichosporon oleaginosum]
MALDDRPRVPPPIYLRSSSTQPQSKAGTLHIHVPGWGIALVRPPRQYDLHPLDVGGTSREPPAEDTVLTGTLEVVMKERRRVRAISIGVQSVCRLNMMGSRGWEEDGIFERGVEILGDDDGEGIWLEKGSQSFTFSILLPATLATHDYHAYGRVSYILTARVEGMPATGRLNQMFKSRETPIQGAVPFLADFNMVIARSDKIALEQAAALSGSAAPHLSRGSSHDRSDSLSSSMSALGLGLDTPPTPGSDVAIAFGDESSSPSTPLRGLYHRRHSSNMLDPPQMNGSSSPSGSRPSPLRRDTEDQASIRSRSSSVDLTAIKSEKAEKAGWLIGDICGIRAFKVHANPAPSGGAYQLDIRKEGYVEGLGLWRFSATSDAFSVASVMMVNLTIPAPSPKCSIFFVRLILSQSYVIYSPRTPNDAPTKAEAPKNHVVYQVGRPHRHGEAVLGHSVEALWRGPEAGGKSTSAGWRTRAVARLPNHEKIRPSTNPGTITPIRVAHEFLLRVFYSIEGESVAGKPIKGPGEVRMCQVRLPVIVPSCLCSTATLNLPTYECAREASKGEKELDPSKMCQCGTSFAELSAAALRRPEAEALPDDWQPSPDQPSSQTNGKVREASREPRGSLGGG